MSRVGKQKIVIPDKVTVEQDGELISARGPLGTVSRTFRPDIAITIAPGLITLEPANRLKGTGALWGTYASHLKNMVIGVTAGFKKKLIIEGIGYRVSLSGLNLTFSLGFSHPVILAIPEGLKVTVDKNNLAVSGVDKEAVGRFAATIRDLKPPEPYKGKGIRYDTEVVRRKEGKKVVS